eukprot:gene3105-3883_t
MSVDIIPLAFKIEKDEIFLSFDDRLNHVIFKCPSGFGYVSLDENPPKRKKFCSDKTVKDAKFSPNVKYSAIQFSDTDIEILHLETGARYSQPSRYKSTKGTQILGFFWTNNDNILYLTNTSIELYQVSDYSGCKLVKENKMKITSFIYSAKYGVLLVYSGGNSILPFLFRTNSFDKLGKFSIESTSIPLDMKNLFVTKIHNKSYCIYGDHNQLFLYELNLETIYKIPSIKLLLPGPNSIHFVDNLIIVHSELKISIVFDLKMIQMDREKEKGGSEFPISAIQMNLKIPSTINQQSTTDSLTSIPQQQQQQYLQSQSQSQSNLYSPTWKYIYPNFIYDTSNGSWFEVSLNFDKVSNFLQFDSHKIIPFLQQRTLPGAKDALLTLIRNIIECRAESLEDIGKIYDDLNRTLVKHIGRTNTEIIQKHQSSINLSQSGNNILSTPVSENSTIASKKPTTTTTTTSTVQQSTTIPQYKFNSSLSPTFSYQQHQQQHDQSLPSLTLDGDLDEDPHSLLGGDFNPPQTKQQQQSIRSIKTQSEGSTPGGPNSTTTHYNTPAHQVKPRSPQYIDISSEDMYEHVFSVLYEKILAETSAMKSSTTLTDEDKKRAKHRLEMDSKYLISIITEYIRSLNFSFCGVSDSLYDLLLSLFVNNQMYSQLHQYLQYYVITDSINIAYKLLSIGEQYPPALQLSLDMFKRKGFSPVIISTLLERGQVMAGIRLLRTSLLDSTDPKSKNLAIPFLRQASDSGDDTLFYSVYKYFESNNQILAAPQFDKFTRLFIDKFGEKSLNPRKSPALTSSSTNLNNSISTSSGGSLTNSPKTSSLSVPITLIFLSCCIPSTLATTICQCVSKSDSIIGKSEIDLLTILNGCPYRVVKRDGVSLPVTLDYRVGRLNLEIQNGLVVAVHVEGWNDLVCPDNISASPFCRCVNLARSGELIGKSKGQLNVYLKDCKWRIVKIDGIPQPITYDLVAGRINVEMVNDKVTYVQIEGEESLDGRCPKPITTQASPCSCAELAKNGQLIGKLYKEATELLRGCDWRIVKFDGRSLPITFDLRVGRLNLEIRNGRIVDVVVEAEAELACSSSTRATTFINNPSPNPVCKCVERARQGEFIGVSLADIETKLQGCRYQITLIDNVPQPITLDLVIGRLIIKVDNGKISVVSIEAEMELDCPGPTPQPQSLTPCDCQKIAPTLIGKSEGQARQIARGCVVRVVEIDGVPQITDRMYLVGRLNLKLTKGKVTFVNVEGEADIICPRVTITPRVNNEAACACAEVARSGKLIGTTPSNSAPLLQGCRWRVTMVDGQPQIITKDFVIGRLNLHLVNGQISNVEIEGEVNLICTVAVPMSVESPTICDCVDRSKQLVGKTREQVSQILRGCSWRIVEIDGVPQMITMDLRIGRINLSIVNNVVTSVDIEQMDMLPCPASEVNPTPCDCVDRTHELIGKPQIELPQYLSGCKYRIASVDGVPRILTKDLILGRINVDIVAGKVSAFVVEGRNDLPCRSSPDTPISVCDCIKLSQQIIGKTQQEASDILQTCRHRVVSVDGVPQAVTLDYVVGRLNLDIVNGRVSSFSIEGESETGCSTTPNTRSPITRPPISIEPITPSPASGVCRCAALARSGVLIGKTQLESYSLLRGCRSRVVSIDGVPQIITMDFVVGRLNIDVVNDRITAVHIEGESSLNCSPPVPTTTPFFLSQVCQCYQKAQSGELIGKTLAQVRAMNCTARIVKLDGVDQPITKDYRIGRLNLEVVNGKITVVHVEGEDELSDCIRMTIEPQPLSIDPVVITTPISPVCVCDRLAHSGQLIGKTEDELKAINCLHRIVMRDGRPLPVTMDYRPGRLNVSVMNGKVTGVTVEGENDLDCHQEVFTFPTDEPKPTTDPKVCDCVAMANSGELIGLTPEEVSITRDCLSRVVKIDGEGQIITSDWRPGRLNLEIENGHITKVNIEGESTLTCIVATVQPITPPPITPELCRCIDLANNEIIGKTRAEVTLILTNCRWRVVSIDGQPQFITADWSPGRINIDLVNGRVSGFSIEGIEAITCPAATPKPKSVCECYEISKSLIGKTKAEADKLLAGCSSRVAEIDGVPQPLTKDLRIGRINLYLRNNRVIKVWVEGENQLNCPVITINPIRTNNGPCECVAKALRGQLNGKTLTQVATILRGCRYRVVTIDGIPQPVTFDYVVGRLNLDIENGRVVGYDIEGLPDLNCPNVNTNPTPCECVNRSLGIIGKTEAQAKTILFGCRNRVVSIDGVGQPTTDDYVIGRINMDLQDGLVSSFEIEGSQDLDC